MQQREERGAGLDDAEVCAVECRPGFRVPQGVQSPSRLVEGDDCSQMAESERLFLGLASHSVQHLHEPLCVELPAACGSSGRDTRVAA
eukprot:6189932-Pleurochrysis_carterae.AAC.2